MVPIFRGRNRGLTSAASLSSNGRAIAFLEYAVFHKVLAISLFSPAGASRGALPVHALVRVGDRGLQLALTFVSAAAHDGPTRAMSISQVRRHYTNPTRKRGSPEP